MKARDVSLLGFVSSAKNYIDRHMDEDVDLGDLNKVDINTLKDDLMRELRSFNAPKETISSLLSAGGEAFNEYVKEKIENKTNSVLDSLGVVFSDSLSSNVNPIEKKNEPVNKLEKFLGNFENKDNSFKSLKDLSAQAYNTNEDNSFKSLKDLNAQAYNTDEAYKKQENKTENIKELSNDFGLAPDDQILLAIQNAASKSDEELTRRASTKIPENMDKVLRDVVSNENKASNLSQELKELARQSSTAIKVENENLQANKVGSAYEDLTNELLYKNAMVNDSEIETNSEDITPTFQYIENPGLDIIENYVPGFNNPNKKKAKQSDNESNENVDISNLKEFVYRKEKENDGINSTVLENIANVYPYLSNEFIKSAYQLKSSLAKEFDEHDTIVILHRGKFEKIDKLYEFIEIVMDHGYLVNVDERKMIVDVFKEFDNTKGLILSNIFTIANQVKILNGDYEGYRVLKRNM